MHNRHFIINMVIGGEKAPAFSATTLTLPPPQIDNTGLIIENTRRIYSRSRAEIEKEISLAIQPPEHLQQRPVQSTAQARQWPVNAQSQTITPDRPTQPQNDTLQQSNPNPESSEPAKRKRTRTRKRKPSNPDQQAGPTNVPRESTQQPTPVNTDHTEQLNLR